MNYIVNENANPAKNATLYKTNKPNTPVRLLTLGCNTAIENLVRFIEAFCAPLLETMKSRIKNTDHLLNIIDEINSKGIPEETNLVSVDIINMLSSIKNATWMAAMQKILEQRNIKKPSSQCIIEG